MEILLWLAPAGVVAIVAMAWAAWWGREGRGEVDHDEALRRLGAALDGPARRGRGAPRTDDRRPAPPSDPTSGGAVRRTGPAPLRAAPAVPDDTRAPGRGPDAEHPAAPDVDDPPARRVS